MFNNKVHDEVGGCREVFIVPISWDPFNTFLNIIIYNLLFVYWFTLLYQTELTVIYLDSD